MRFAHRLTTITAVSIFQFLYSMALHIIQPLNAQIGFNANSIQRRIQLLIPQIGFNVNSIERQIQPLNPQIGFNVNSIQ